MENKSNVPATICKEMLMPKALSAAVREAGIDTPRKSVECGMATVRRTVREIGYRDTAAVMLMQLSRLEMMLNVSHPMHPEAMAEIAKMIVDLCISEEVQINFADVDIVFRRAAGGYYGKFYGGFGSAEVMNWFSSYIAEKAQAYVDYNVEQSQQYKSNAPRSAEMARVNELIKHKKARAAYVNGKLK